MIEIENMVFSENFVFPKKHIVFFVGMTFSSVLRLLVGIRESQIQRWVLGFGIGDSGFANPKSHSSGASPDTSLPASFPQWTP